MMRRKPALLVNVLLIVCASLAACVAPAEVSDVPTSTLAELAPAPTIPAETPVKPTSTAEAQAKPIDIGEHLETSIEGEIKLR